MLNMIVERRFRVEADGIELEMFPGCWKVPVGRMDCFLQVYRCGREVEVPEYLGET